MISLKDVADEFGESVDVIQQDVVGLNFAGKLNYKIDASRGMLHKCVEDPKLAMLNQINEIGTQFAESMET